MKYFFIILSLISIIKCDIDFLVVEGEDAEITQFPHCAALYVICKLKWPDGYWRCGASIINQRIMLTAAHCVAGCVGGDRMFVSVGHRNMKGGDMSSVQRVFAHNYLRNKIDLTLNDIALLQLKTRLTFNDRVRRVALMRKPPYSEKAQLAGWGWVKETDPKQKTNELHYVDQYVWKTSKCKRVTRRIYKGTLCASSRNASSYISGGDSGSALVVRGYIQIGIVSYKKPHVSRSLTVYTDTGYYYNWIRKYSRKLYCVAEKTLPISDDLTH